MLSIRRQQLGVQIHALRHELAKDAAGVLSRLSAMGISNLELCHFPGFAGNPWGDFGGLADWPAERIAEELLANHLHAISVHVMHRNLGPRELGASVAWARAVGCRAVVLAGFPGSAGDDLETWRQRFQWLNETGRRLADEGIDFAYHTQNDVWQIVDGALLANEMFRIVNPKHCVIELDPSGCLVYGTDWTKSVAQHPNRYLAFHLRDGKAPGVTVPWLPALPLGTGEVDWTLALETAGNANIPYYLLEMEVENSDAVFAAIENSIRYLESIGALLDDQVVETK